MNKIWKVILATLGGISITIDMFTPIILATIWINIGEFQGIAPYVIFILAGLATLFRAIKVGFLTNVSKIEKEVKYNEFKEESFKEETNKSN